MFWSCYIIYLAFGMGFEYFRLRRLRKIRASFAENRRPPLERRERFSAAA